MLNCLPNNSILTPSASNALYLIFTFFKSIEKNTLVLLPSNICFQVLMSAWQADCHYLFIDSHEQTGNFTIEILRQVVCHIDRQRHPVVVLLCAHIHGVLLPMHEIKQECIDRDMYIVEDCAQACLSSYAYNPCLRVGSYGDFAVYSFGKTKQLSLGYGGLLVRQNPSLQPFPYPHSTLTKTMPSGEFRLAYYQYIRRITESPSTYLSKSFEYFLRSWSTHFCFDGKIPSHNEVSNLLTDAEETAIFYQNIQRFLSAELIKLRGLVSLLPYSSTDVLWRFSFLVTDIRVRDSLLLYLRCHDIACNSLYASLPALIKFEPHKFSGSQSHASRIVNLSTEGLTLHDLTNIVRLITKFFV